MIYALIPLMGQTEIPKTLAEMDVDVFRGVEPRAWLIAYNGSTNDLADKIWPDELLGQEGYDYNALLFHVERYSGFADEDVWNWINIKS